MSGISITDALVNNNGGLKFTRSNGTFITANDAIITSGSVNDDGILTLYRGDASGTDNAINVSGNIKGPRGYTGPQGPIGMPGIQGETGPAGSYAYISENTETENKQVKIDENATLVAEKIKLNGWELSIDDDGTLKTTKTNDVEGVSRLMQQVIKYDKLDSIETTRTTDYMNNKPIGSPYNQLTFVVRKDFYENYMPVSYTHLTLPTIPLV